MLSRFVRAGLVVSIFVGGALGLYGCAATWAGTQPVSTAPTRVTVELAPGGVGSVATGGPASEAQTQLEAALGPAQKVEDSQSCRLGGDGAVPYQLLSWGALTVTLRRTDATLLGWTVRSGALPTAVSLPYGVTTATSVRAALGQIPDSKPMWDDVFGMYQITTRQATTMMWSGDKADASGLITFITNAFEPCD